MVIGNVTDPVVDKAWRKRRSWKKSRQSLFWFGVNLLLSLLLYYELNFNTIGSCFEVSHPLLWYTECALIVVFLFNTLANLMVYVRPYLMPSTVEVTDGQKKLLGVKDTELGFRVSPRKSPSSVSSEGSLIFASTPSGQSSFSSSGSPRSVGHVTPTNVGAYPGHMSFGIPSPSVSFGSYGSPSTSYDRMPVQNLSSLSVGPNASFGSHNASMSPGMSYSHNMSYSPGVSFSSQGLNLSQGSGLHSSLESSGLRSRHSLSSFKHSPVMSYDQGQITDQHSLTQFLKEQEEKDTKKALSSPDANNTGGTSFWSYGRSAMDYTHVLRKYMYQLATRSPQSSTARNNDNDQSSSYGGDDVWSKRGVTEDDLYLWTEHLRKWICQTVVSRLAQEITNANAKLRRIGSEDTEIGEVSVSTLKQLALTKGPLLPTLNSIVPYLDISSNQEYLVRRILDLGKDGCMSEFSWQGGGYYGKAWGEHLPTDAGIVMHLLCTYLDSRLPPQPKYPDGRTFTTQYFVKTPDKPNLEKEDTLCIYQSSINPPHFQVVTGKSILNLPKGRNNMFQALLLFLHVVKTKEHGMLGRVNLGASGVNMLWIFS
ncbi:transmembrane protein 209-like [Pecten maximus]|uniref:transmembrane protein 209-like n=1 Tax=Pecten maximus TaxID=6579 RepID=UPI001458420B|nr:transmembrane protein 209-like [Pecten maximus]